MIITSEEKKQAARCKICSETIHAVAAVSSNLIRRLKRKRECEYTQQEIELARPPKITSVLTAGCSAVHVQRKPALGDAVINMIRTDMEPFRVAERKGFMQFVTVSLTIL